jgi:hypothetical protein
VSLKKQKSQGKAVEVTGNSKEENSLRLLSGFRPRIRLRSQVHKPKREDSTETSGEDVPFRIM